MKRADRAHVKSDTKFCAFERRLLLDVMERIVARVFHISKDMSVHSRQHELPQNAK
jgi:hypothetical protein